MKTFLNSYCLQSLSKKVLAPAKERPPGGAPTAGPGREGGPVALPNEMGGAEERRETPSSGKREDRGGAREEAQKADSTVPSAGKAI